MKRLLFFAALAALASGAGELERIAAVTHPDLAEMSGIVASSYPGVFWVHNDSGDSPRIFAIRPDAGIVVPGFIRAIYPDRTSDDWPGYTIDNAWNGDWEDIALVIGTLRDWCRTMA